MNSVKHLCLSLAVALVMAVGVDVSATTALSPAAAPAAPALTAVTFYSKAEDGEVVNIGCPDWATCRNASSGNRAWTIYGAGTVSAAYVDSTYHVKRLFFFFDTSTIPAGAQIVSAQLAVYAGQWQKASTGFYVVRSTAGLPLSVADFSRFAYQSGGFAKPPANTWAHVGLNATALGWIVKGGMTKLALIAGGDMNNVVPAGDSSMTVAMSEDASHCPRLTVSYYPPSTASVVVEARADIGMPYDTNRGCPSPYTGCGGRYHGFYRGVCTDLALDSYRAGAGFAIQEALSADSRANPGRYRYDSARNAEDMRRYFVCNQAFLAPAQPYRPGDIAFFDWDGDGLTNHVLVITSVDGAGRPVQMADASGVIPGINASGLAFEHNWSTYYEAHAQGHGRLSSLALAAAAPATETLQVLRVSAQPASVGLSLWDTNGKSVSAAYDDNLVASNVEASIPYIPGGHYESLATETVISVTQPLSNTDRYYVRIDAPVALTYTVLLETVQGGAVTAQQTFTRSVAAGQTDSIDVALAAPDGLITFTAQAPLPSAAVSLPSSLVLQGLVGTSAQASLTVQETGGQQAAGNVTIAATDLSTPFGIKLPPERLTVYPQEFSLGAGGSQQVDVQVDLAGQGGGEYLGSLVLTCDGRTPMMVPIAVHAEGYPTCLPVILRP